MKKLLIIFCLFFLAKMQAQNKQILYGFDKIPQGLLLNPGGESSYKYHIGVPLISGLSANGNISGITIADVFRDDGIGAFAGSDFNTKVDNALLQLGDKDYASANAQIDVLNFGYKLNKRDYLSFGFYEEVDVFVGFPKQLFTLINEGNANRIGETFTASNVAVKAEVLGVLHAGISRRYNNRITAGARLKIYSGALNINSNNNTGSFRTNLGEDGIYRHTLSNLDAELNTSGVYDENDESVSTGDVIGNTFFSRNLGVGIDVGFTFHATEQLEFTASLLDIGFVSYSKDVRNFSVQGGYTFSGVDFEYDQGLDYYEEVKDDFLDNVTEEENSKSYAVLRPVKFNSSVRYSFGKSRYEETCHDIRLKDYYDNAVGGQLYAVSRPYGVRFALTGFYERKFADFLNTKVTYTIDDFSATNVGLGISTNIWKFNVYGMVDNIFKIGDIADAHTASLQFGVNLIFD